MQNYSSTHISNNIVSTPKNSYSTKYNDDNKKFNEHETANPDAKILLASTLFKGNESKFLVDSGSDLSFIKESKISNKKKIDRSNIIEVCGLSTHKVKTRGTISVSIAETKCRLHVLDDTSINLSKYDGILGKDFTQKADCDILLSQNCLRIGNVFIPFINDEIISIPARTKQLLTLNIKNYEKKKDL